MIAAAGKIAHLDQGARQPTLDHFLDILRFHQSFILARGARRIPQGAQRS
jgi:hypothetical protein